MGCRELLSPNAALNLLHATTRPDFVEGKYFLHFDALGDAIGLTDANGDIVERYQYGAFGRAIVYDRSGTAHPTSLVGNPFLFGMAIFDAESGLYHMGLRDLDPAIGRFLQEDPIGLAGGDSSLYGFARCNPLTFRDERGLVAETATSPLGGSQLRETTIRVVDPRNEIPLSDNWLLMMIPWLEHSVGPYIDGGFMMVGGGLTVYGGLVTAGAIGAVGGPPGVALGVLVGSPALAGGSILFSAGYTLIADQFYNQTGIDLRLPNAPQLIPNERVKLKSCK